MSSQERRIVAGTRLHRRQNNSPCPGGNGTTIGTAQQFTVVCSTNLPGDFLSKQSATDLAACADLCSSFHPKCDGAVFDGKQCFLNARLQSNKQRPSRRLDSIVGQFPGASSNCATLSGTQQALGSSFTAKCGFIINGFDLSQNFAPTLQDCMGQCASTTGCAALSFDPSQDLGFKNCYLKTTITNSSAVIADQQTDSAVLAAAAAAPASSSNAAATSSAAGAGVSTLPLTTTSSPVVAAPAAGSGAIFFTPPAGASGSTASPAAPPSSPTSTSAPAPGSGSGATTSSPTPTASNILGGTPSLLSLSLPAASTLLPFFLPHASTGTAQTQTPLSLAVPDASASQDDAAPASAPNMAWVAAPVVGSLAAIALIAVSFILLRRRRRGNNYGDGGDGSPGMGSGRGWYGSGSEGRGGGGGGKGRSLLPGGSAWLLGSPPPSRRAGSLPRGVEGGGGRGKKKGGSGRVMGNFVGVESGRRSVEVRRSVRSSVVGLVTGRGEAGMERLEDIEERGGRGRRGGDAEVKTATRIAEPEAAVVREKERESGASGAEGKTARPQLRQSQNGLGQNKWSSSS